MNKKEDSMTDQEFIEKSEALLNSDSGGPQPRGTIGATSTSSTTVSPDQMKLMLLHATLTDKKTYQEPTKWISAFNQYHKVRYVYKSDSVMKDGVKIDMKTYLAFVRTTIKEMGLSRNFSRQCVEDMVTLWLSREKEHFLREVRTKLSYKPSGQDWVRAWVKAATRREDQVDIAVMRHFIWQVRRKLYGMDVEYHMMPILYGKSGGGKSQAVIHLLRPMDDLCLNMDLSIFSDQFRMRLFTKAFVMFFDEMAKSERADIDRLKNVITSPIIDFRRMHSEDLESTPQNCTFIGCSNDTVYDKIYDPTSARRYWQLDCADKLDWSLINSIPYLDLWRSVDEKAPCPLLPVLNEVSTVQDKKIRSKDLIEDWAEMILSLGKNQPKENPSSLELYESFKQHCAFQKINNVPTFNKFSRRLPQVLKNLMLDAPSYRSSRGTLWPLMIGQPFSSRVNLQAAFDAGAQIEAQEIAEARVKAQQKG